MKKIMLIAIMLFSGFLAYSHRSMMNQNQENKRQDEIKTLFPRGEEVRLADTGNYRFCIPPSISAMH